MTELTIQGAGGGGGGGTTFVQRPDNLRSTDRFEGLLGLGAGPWKGLVNGFQSLTMNGTPIEDADGNSNFDDFDAIFANGDPLQFPQKVELRLGAGGTPTNVGLTITNTNTAAGTGSPGPWLPQSISNTNADFLDLRFVVQQLYAQDEKGIKGATAHLEIQMKPSGASTWMNPQLDGSPAAENPTGVYDLGDGTSQLMLGKYFAGGVYTPVPGVSNNGWFQIEGKTTSSYVHEIRILVPRTGNYANKGWDVRVRLRERADLDADPNFEKRVITWESIAAGYNTVYGVTEPWRGLAWLQLYGKASNQLNGVPTILGEFDTLIVPTPPVSVYNPDTRSYTGAVWDGSWVQSFTNDPAWCINGIMQDSLHGLSSISPMARLNKWDALAASKWFSQQVPDGNGGTEPRSSLNLAINEPQKAKDFIQYLAGAVGAICWEGNQGEWHLRVDKPEQPVDILTVESIIGEFRYSHSDVEQRYNDITAVFRNKEFGYREDRVRVVDNAAIARFGRKPLTITLVGCTGRQEALRRAIMRLRVANNETRSVRFQLNRRGRLLERLDSILIADADLNRMVAEEPRSTGRIVAVAPDRTWVDVRDPVRLELGAAYSLVYSYFNPDYDPETPTDPTGTEWLKPTLTASISILNNSSQRGDVRRLYLATPLPGNVAENLNISLSAPGLPALPKAYRILNIEESEGEIISISAIEIDSGKWAASDAGVVEQEITNSLIDGTVPPPEVPSGSTLLSVQTLTTDAGIRRYIVVNWDRPSFGYIAGYRLQYRHNGGNWQNLGVLDDSYFEQPAFEAGDYEFRIYTRDIRGRESVPLVETISLFTGIAIGGSDGAPSIAGVLTNESHTVATNNTGGGGDYAAAGGTFKVYVGQSDYTTGNGVAYAKAVGAPAWISINSTTGVYTVTDPGADTASATLEATYNGVVIPKVYSITKSKQGANGTGANAIMLRLISDSQTVPTEATGVASNGADVLTFTAEKQNTTAGVTFTLTKIDGTAVAGGVTLSGTGNVRTLTHAQFDTARGATSGVIVTASVTDGVTLTDKVSVVQVQKGLDGVDGLNGVDGLTAYLTNEVVQLPATEAGVVTSYAAASGEFKIFAGAVDVSANFTLSTPAGGNPQGLAGNYTGRNYNVSGGLDPAEDVGKLTIRATGTAGGPFAGKALDKVFSVSKARVGPTGASPPLVTLSASDRTFQYNATGQLVAKTIVFTAVKQNGSGAITWVIRDSAGAVVLTGNHTAIDADPVWVGTSDTQISISHTSFATWVTGRPERSTFSVEAQYSGTATDTVTINTLRDGVNGAAATSAYLTNESVQLASYANGGVTDYSPATGSFKVFAGATDISANFTLSTLTNLQLLTILYSGQTYTVTGGLDPNEDTATVRIRASGSGPYSGLFFDKDLTISKAKVGYEIVSSLPTTNLFPGRWVSLATEDYKLYRYNGSRWVGVVSGDNLIANPQGAEGLVGWRSATETTGAIAVTSLQAGFGWYRPDRSGIWLFKPTTADGVNAECRAFRVTPGNSYFIRLRRGANTSTTTGFYLRAKFDALQPASGYASGSGGEHTMFINTAVAAGEQVIEGSFVCPPGMYWCSINVYSWSGGPTELYFSDVDCREQLSDTQISANLFTGDRFQAGVVTAARGEFTELSALSGNMGTLVAGEMRSANGNFVVDLDEARIVNTKDGFMNIYGNGFGTSNQFLEWFGPAVSHPSQCAEANAVIYKKTNGQAYYAGAVATGVINDSASGPYTVSGGTLVHGPISANGVLTQTVTFSLGHSVYTTSLGTTPASGSLSATCVCERSTNGGTSWTQIGSFTATGDWYTTPANPFGPGVYSSQLGGSVTVTETVATTTDLRYRLRVTSTGQPDGTISIARKQG